MYLESTGIRQNQFSRKNCNETMNYLSDYFPGKLISLRVNISCLPRSPYLPIPNFPLWSLKAQDMGCSQNWQRSDLNQLEMAIVRECGGDSESDNHQYFSCCEEELRKMSQLQ